MNTKVYYTIIGENSGVSEISYTLEHDPHFLIGKYLKMGGEYWEIVDRNEEVTEEDE